MLNDITCKPTNTQIGQGDAKMGESIHYVPNKSSLFSLFIYTTMVLWLKQQQQQSLTGFFPLFSDKNMLFKID